MDITLQEITVINKELGASMVSTASIEFALHAGVGRSLYWRLALLWRAILIDHPFSDANKRTALNATFLMLKRNKIRLNEEAKERITREILKVAKKNINSTRKIERGVRYAIEGNQGRA